MDSKSFKLNTNWICWYHDPYNKQWSIDSYVQLYRLETIYNVGVFNNSLKSVLPKLEKGMYFIMRVLENDDYIYPIWEDKNNKNGGIWSFKINNVLINKIWNDLMVYLLGENILTNSDNYNLINGISVSPKRNFVILKIWSTKKIEKNEFNTDLKKIINFDEGIYKNHNTNIEKDGIKKTSVKKTNKKRYF